MGSKPDRRPARVLVVGLDGADLGLIVPWARAGRLPHFERLLAEGAWGGLRSTFPPMTAPAWTTFMSGLLPEHHGVTDFHHRISFAYERQQPMISSRDTPKAFWEIASDFGCKVIVQGVPVTYPIRPVNGVVIGGLLTPEHAADFVYPAELRPAIERLTGGYRITAAWQRFSEGSELNVFHDLLQVLQAQISVSKHLLETRSWDLGIFVYSAPDQVQHFYWKYMAANHPGHCRDSQCALREAIYTVYREFDRFLGYLLTKYPETPLFVISDHGAGPQHCRFHLDQWLMQRGLLDYSSAHQADYNKPTSFMNLLEEFPTAHLETTVPGAFGIGPGEISVGLWPRRALLAHPDTRITYLLKQDGDAVLHCAPAIDGAYWDPRYGDGVEFIIEREERSSTQEIYRAVIDPKRKSEHRQWQDLEVGLPRIIAGETKVHLATKLGPRRSYEWTACGWVEPSIRVSGCPLPIWDRPPGIRMHETLAYGGSETELGIYLNDYPLPFATVTDAKQHREVCESIARQLAELRDSSGRQVFFRIRTRAQEQGSSSLLQLPDVQLVPYRFLVMPDDDRADVAMESSWWRSGSHRQYGIIMAHGPSIPRIRTKRASIADLAPTILALLLGVELKADGRVLHELLLDCLPSALTPLESETAPPESRGLAPDEDQELRNRLKNLGYLQ